MACKSWTIDAIGPNRTNLGTMSSIGLTFWLCSPTLAFQSGIIFAPLLQRQTGSRSVPSKPRNHKHKSRLFGNLRERNDQHFGNKKERSMFTEDVLRKANWVGSLTGSPGESRHEVYSGSIHAKT